MVRPFSKAYWVFSVHLNTTFTKYIQINAAKANTNHLYRCWASLSYHAASVHPLVPGGTRKQNCNEWQ